MSTFEQRRRGILRTALELERDLFAAENRYIVELKAGLTELEAEFAARYARIIAEPREDGHFDWERSQVESLLAEYQNQLAYWERRATSTINQGVTDADAMGQEYPANILKAGSSQIDLRHVRPGLNGTQLAAFHSYTSGLVRGVSDKVRGDVTGLVRRAALGGDSPFATMQKIGTVTGKGAFATAFHRGEAILRTEMGRAYSSADMIAIRNAAEFNPGLRKRWLSIIDGRVRPEHAAAHDQTKKIDEPFIVGGERLMHPHDTNGSAWNTINCRCKAVPWDPAWDELAKKAGESGELGPLALADQESFDSRLRELERVKDVFGEQGSTMRRSRRGTVGFADWPAENERMTERANRWPTPMNPSYWRSKASFTADQLRSITASDTTFAAFLRERYGITAAWDSAQSTPFGAPLRLKITEALELVRALDPAFVVENRHMRHVISSYLGRDTAGEADVFGAISINQSLVNDVTGKTRDPEGINLPRLSDDAALEVVLHEIAHAISYQGGTPLGQGTVYDYTAAAPLPKEAWTEWEAIHTTSFGVGDTSATEYMAQEKADELMAEMDAKAKLGWTWEQLGEMRDLVDLLLDSSGPPSGVDPYPSEYAKQSVNEDFAESVTLALLQPAEFKRGYPARYAWLQKYYPKLVQ